MENGSATERTFRIRANVSDFLCLLRRQQPRLFESILTILTWVNARRTSDRPLSTTTICIVLLINRKYRHANSEIFSEFGIIDENLLIKEMPLSNLHKKGKNSVATVRIFALIFYPSRPLYKWSYRLRMNEIRWKKVKADSLLSTFFLPIGIRIPAPFSTVF